MPFSLRGIVMSSLFGALLVALSFFNLQLGFTPVPITFENFVIMLTGALLGPFYGFFSVFLVVFLTALGFPLFHGSGGLSFILGPTGGYVWAYPFAALLIGFFAKRAGQGGWKTFLVLFISMELFGSLLLYVTGVPWLAHVSELTLNKAMVLGCYPYLPGDAVKALAAAFIAGQIRKVYPMERLIGK